MAIQCPQCGAPLHLNNVCCPFCQHPLSPEPADQQLTSVGIGAAVPWTPRDVWKGVAVQWLLWLMYLMVLVFIRFIPLTLNVGLPILWTELLLCVAVWYFTVRKYRVGWETLGLRRFSGQALGLGVGLLVLFTIFSRIYQVVLTTVYVPKQPALVSGFATRSSPWWLWAGYVVAAPVGEELFFRGFVFGGFRPRYGWQKAAVLSAALFAAVHLRWFTFLPELVLGYLLAYLYERSNSIWPGMLLHAGLNAWILGAAYYAAK